MRSLIRNFLRLPKFPKTFGSAKEFADHNNMLKENHPLRWKISEFYTNTYFNVYHSVYRRFFRDPWWNFKYTYIPKHQYRKVLCDSLKPGYYDPCTIILHAPFDTFATFMKNILDGKAHLLWDWSNEEPNEDYGIDQEEIDSGNARWKEMNDLYEWWTVTRPNREEALEKLHPHPELPKEWGFLSVINEDFDNESNMVEWKRVSKIHLQAEDDWEKEDDANLIRLIKLRSSLWD